MLESVVAVGVPHHNLPVEGPAHEPEGLVAVPANPDVLHHPQRLPQGGSPAQQPIRQGEPLAVPLHLAHQLLHLGVYLRRPRVPPVARQKLVHLPAHLNPTPPALLLHSPVPHRAPQLRHLVPSPGRGVDVGEHDVRGVVLRVHLQNPPAGRPPQAGVAVGHAGGQERSPDGRVRLEGHQPRDALRFLEPPHAR
ncbi:unnamed protein product [Spirodela intermedia]|uniref:Uncharacterized protein n=1 Tax=Spirodela intermedia TaxID=51605 RepID=A0A7I8LKS6_SPIIN|nr:unnamed protein product [Spirodela intermedia]